MEVHVHVYAQAIVNLSELESNIYLFCVSVQVNLSGLNGMKSEKTKAVSKLGLMQLLARALTTS